MNQTDSYKSFCCPFAQCDKSVIADNTDPTELEALEESTQRNAQKCKSWVS